MWAVEYAARRTRTGMKTKHVKRAFSPLETKGRSRVREEELPRRRRPNPTTRRSGSIGDGPFAISKGCFMSSVLIFKSRNYSLCFSTW